MTALHLFVCSPLQGAKLTRRSCAQRYVAASGGPRKGRLGGMEPNLLGPCGSCPIGAAHARGEMPATWPDGSRIETAACVVGVAPQLAERRVGPKRRRQRRTYTHDGRALTAYQWATQPEACAELDGETVRGRLRLGWPVLAAITTPRNTTGRRRTRAS